ncbi:hypothetical protein Nham_0307 [Nitrobacter hamburgensis X14]|uniref:Uncharacterized protein n=1 Tax=Nitrobacter hamburgensis (strain DSM 10229 / NCIMB 13809 / X14) TaxID=323097 RepID=Q1QRE4_NITHX|nr:hypothetical protein [Nitrobacter hamburgensis]ABE61203.1 hypothetical protein Nham_0307 [Nitrobacter hamburgensis X14]
MEKEWPTGGGYYSSYEKEGEDIAAEFGLTLNDQAVWSDRFFNHLDVANWHKPPTLDVVIERAAGFKKEHPLCPYSSHWLVEDFARRL